ncbi:MAG TPA: hypothetical protein VMV08_00685 [Gaiellaceae bacterium]|nr:hypothetical protein [Gaiellaceae bacterium]
MRPSFASVLARLAAQQPIPWARPRRELLLLCLIALATLFWVYEPNTQDNSRLCLTRALVAGHVSADACFTSLLPHQFDVARYKGHFYSDKAPGMSVLEIVPAEIVSLRPPTRWAAKGDLRLWAVHLLTSGLLFLLCVFLVGRISEGLAPGYGGAALVTFALGTQMSSLAIAGFDQMPAAALGFLAFVLAWKRRPLAAGLAAGAALTTEYEAAAILAIIAVYVALQGRRALARYALGALPGIALLGAYDWAAFGAPWRPSYHYLHNRYAAQQGRGLLGIQLPTLHATEKVFLGDRGLLLAAPVLLAAAFGLVLLWRRGLRAEALVCGVITAGFTIANCGYFLPYGGDSPGPRFLAPALPFLALGLAPAFARMRRVVTVLAAVSIIASTAIEMTWDTPGIQYRDTIWGEIGRVVTQGTSSRLLHHAAENALSWNKDRIIGVLVACSFAAAACVVAARRPGLRRT